MSMEAMEMLMPMKDQAMRINMLMRKGLRRGFKGKIRFLCLRRFSCLEYRRVRILRSLLFRRRLRLLLLRVIGYIDGGPSSILSLSCMSCLMQIKRTF